jgi:hypothetical protein
MEEMPFANGRDACIIRLCCQQFGDQAVSFSQQQGQWHAYFAPKMETAWISERSAM